MSSSSAKMWTPANIVTIIRIIGIPFLVVVMLAPWEQLFANANAVAQVKPWVSAFFFLVLSFSDFLDGYLARSRNEVTNFGKFMDPLADKLLVAAAFLVMIQTRLLPAWVLLIVLFREFLVSGLRMMAASCGQVIAASWYGKAKTVTQMIAIVLFILIDALPALLGSAWQTPVFYAAWFMLIVSLVLTILSMVDYFAKSKSVFFDEPVSAKDAPCEPSTSNDVLEHAEEVETITLPNDALDLPLVSANVLYSLAQDTLEKARNKKLSLGTAESLTGGFISATLTAVPGSSSTFVGGIASYAFSAKEQLLGVEAARLDAEGAVNDWTATQMACGARKALACDITVAVTGIAGPGGEEPGKPVGTVWTAVASSKGSHARKFEFSGTREEVRIKTVEAALLLMQEEIKAF